MQAKTNSYMGVMIFAVVFGALAYFVQWRTGNGVETILAVVTIVFCLGLLIKQKWALIGMCLTLLVGIGAYFVQAWLQPIVEEDPSLILPNVAKMIVGILLFMFIGRARIEHEVF